ncbi:SPOSA6832_02711 [Sporobolomyces salmonicolor]|uniref:SPOSA6832_02711-mRNA-1:cds n=1 Tax=Sporidiobolus salmonicolor TaxID=5005 RepID=A0A0D6ELY9_SPOSA|nr:SPOSA6832_02711 [Sporobolomyces salmonicolor]
MRADPSCNYVGNAILSCYPESNTTLVQNIYSKFIWNAQYPTFIGSVDVDIYLYNADTEEIATSWLGVENARGMIGIAPDDGWWPTESTDEWFNSRENRTIPYFFVIVDANTTLTGGEAHQSTFTVIQTAAPSSLSSSLSVLTASSLASASSLSSLSAASLASASSASASSLSAASRSSASASSSLANRPASGTSGSGALQTSPSSSTSLPKWAIAIIVILGFFALLAGAVAVYLCLGRMRKRRRAAEMEVLAAEAGERGDGEDEGEDEITNGSRDPILGAAAGGGAGRGGPLAPADPEKDEGGTISQTDAARMAEAFRAALRKPEFLPPTAAESSGESAPGLGPSPTGRAEGDISHGSTGEETGILGRELMEDELRSEGKSMRNVDGGKRWGA